MPDQVAAQVLADPLAEAYRKAWERLERAQAEMENDPARWRERRRLAELLRSTSENMRELNAEAAEWVRDKLPRVYAIGATAGVVEATGGDAAFTWGQADTEAAQRLANKLYQDLLDATKNVELSTKRLVRRVAQDRALGAVLEGKTARSASREMHRILERHGIYSVVYANGAKHGLGEYSEMAIRTVTATAHNEGTLNGAAGQGVKYWEVFDGPFCGWASHDDRQALGMIVTIDEARAYPISHPNCRRAFGPRPDVVSPEQARGHVTPGQTKAQIAADRAQQRRKTRPDPHGRKRRIRKPD